jgi:hypothetical protein
MAKLLVGNELTSENIAKLCGNRGYFIEFAEADGKTELLYVSAQNGTAVSGLGSEEKKPLLLEGKVSARFLSSSVAEMSDLYKPDLSKLTSG